MAYVFLCNQVLSNDARKTSSDKVINHSEINFRRDPRWRDKETMMICGYNIPLHIAKSGEPHTLEEHLTLPTVEEILNIVLHEPAFNIIKRIL